MCANVTVHSAWVTPMEARAVGACLSVLGCPLCLPSQFCTLLIAWLLYSAAPHTRARTHTHSYVRNVLAVLHKEPTVYDTSRVYLAGCSMGAAMSLWQTLCLDQADPGSVLGFATHSTGLKVKGDGLEFPLDWYRPINEVGECPECESWPARLQQPASRVKACVFDNRADPVPPPNDYFYQSSVALAAQWDALPGNYPAETHFSYGGHCLVHSIEDIVDCLDNQTGRLSAADLPTTTTATNGASATASAKSGVAACAALAALLLAFRRRRR
jgi:hypothetical protein